MSVIDILRQYTAPRGIAVATLFVLAALVRIPTVLLAVVVHALERCATRLLNIAHAIPPQPRKTPRRRVFRGESR